MAYSELIKNFEKIRSYMREFYIYGFKTREEYSLKSSRSYDDERRRIESWIGKYMSFRSTKEGRSVFISVDSRSISDNPLYNAFKAKSFTDGDVAFHFILLDLLEGGKPCNIKEITDYISQVYTPDESSIRKKLKEYEELGIIKSSKEGRQLVYEISKNSVNLEPWKKAVCFFSEEDSLGVIGSFIKDRYEDSPSYFSFKHHYLLHALDSQVLFDLLNAIANKRRTTLEILSSRHGEGLKHAEVLPYKIYVSTRTGRQYVFCYNFKFKSQSLIRLDNIQKVELLEKESQWASITAEMEGFRDKFWGVSCGSGRNLEHIEMTVRVLSGEDYVVARLEREKRGGTVHQIDDTHYVFEAQVYDSAELLPWVRTFIGRIESFKCSKESVSRRFYEDMELLEKMYGGEGYDI